MNTGNKPVGRTDFRLLHRLRVRWSEVDMQQIVFNAHYLMYFDTAVVEYWRALGLPYEEAMRQIGGDLFVKKATIEFHASARMDDPLEVGLRCGRIGNSSMRFDGVIFRGEERLIDGELVYVYADPASQTSRPIPPALRTLLQDFEKGGDLLELRTGSWVELGEAARALRTRVFVEEQRVPQELEWDELDAQALHVVALNRLGQPVGTARLLQAGAGVAKIGRMAVHRGLRGSGLGRRLMGTLLQAAEERGDTRVLLHAQRTAEGFYERLGFRTSGEPFDEAGIPHVQMAAELPRRRTGS
ncbi:YbgC/FadM family acyl-CoA thioesterase [Ramlibacter sp. AW1]|uniref:YbgC/FadM family acyl-CoA thioesterase n=1 Tax=Ramlibacter aurantiacus TaxID=2801330 RepID=A0A936ZD87_9BURK|nr:YbgC/FadM family acyl-CoA thioesterase [Ramlibacter aurantiacus]MBL0418797.1 YbgC/FadM family acyl-CoA thioesterase [Ramlibacter aurantiacus]